MDFISFQENIIVELDGGQHTDNQEYDLQRDEMFRRNGFKVLRFWDDEVFKNIDGVLQKIREHFMASSPIS